MSAIEPVATLIGDLVASRQHENRRQLQSLLRTTLYAVNTQLEPLQALEPTVGDEFQGGFVSPAQAARASLVLRLHLLVHGTDSRYGLGYGPISVFDTTRSPTSQDGVGWWSARTAIDRARKLADAPRTSFARTCFVQWSDEVRPPSIWAAGLDAFLMCRDATVHQMNERQRRLLLGLLLGRSQSALAADEGITQGAVSQNLQRSGAFAIEAAHGCLEQAAT